MLVCFQLHASSDDLNIEIKQTRHKHSRESLEMYELVSIFFDSLEKLGSASFLACASFHNLHVSSYTN
jgi:hypothetical protein